MVAQMNNAPRNVVAIRENQNISPGIYNWIGAGSGVRGAGLNFSVTKSYGRAELYIDRGSKEENEFIFDELSSRKEQLEKDFGGSLYDRLYVEAGRCLEKPTERN